MKQIILHNLRHDRTYHLSPPFQDGGIHKLIIGNKLQPKNNIKVEFDTQEELDALLLAYK